LKQGVPNAIKVFDDLQSKGKLPAYYGIRELLEPIFINGQCIYDRPTTQEIKKYCEEELNSLWDETRRLINPQLVFVDLSDKLFDLKIKMIKEAQEK